MSSKTKDKRLKIKDQRPKRGVRGGTVLTNDRICLINSRIFTPVYATFGTILASFI